MFWNVLDKSRQSLLKRLYHMIKSLSYFDDAEKDPWPVMLKEISWSALKRYFLSSQAKLLKNLS